ncbi:MAG: DNA repair protein RadC [Lachnospiraceae bacterium]|nr:DNA repair protein RadC [Lachnospiraceae bacterium]
MNTTPKNWEDLLPYEKFEIFGAQSLTDSELLAIIIRTGTKDANSIELGKKILNLSNGRGQTNGLLSLQHLTLEELMKIKGIGKVKAIRIKCVTEFSRRIAMETFKKGIRFDKPATIADYYKEQVRHLEVEQVILVMTDGKNQFLKDCVLSIGTVNMSLISPREIFMTALKAHAVHILLVHNHPSGDPTPSRDDIEITKRIHEASQLMNIPLVDHIIIGDNTYMSLKELRYI